MILIWSSFTQIRALLRLRFEAEETHVDFGSVPKRVDKKTKKKQKQHQLPPALLGKLKKRLARRTNRYP